MSVENGKVCCNCRHCKRIKKEHGAVIECRCDMDNAYLTITTVLTYWCRHWAKERQEVMENDDIQKGCRNCKHCSKLITEEPCMDCDPRTDSPKNHWEAEE